MTPQPQVSISSTPALSSTCTQTTRQRLERQLAEHENRFKEPNSRIKKKLLAGQINQLKERLQELDKQDNAAAATEEEAISGSLRVGRNHPSSSLSVRPGLEGSSSSSTESSSLLPLPPPLTGSTTPTKRRAKVPDMDRRKPDIEFATEIGQGLLLEVRKMQALLQQKEEQLSQIQIQKAEMERAAENLAKQLRQREEAEEHLKEETWNLELSKQELTSQVTDLQQDLSRITSDYTRAAKQVNELRQDIERMQDKEEKLNGMMEDMKTRHQHDMSTIRRQYAGVQREKLDQQKQIDALTSELAIARAQSRITKRRQQDTPSLGIDETDSVSPDTSGNEKDAYRNSPNSTSSPPSSPKQTPTRNQALELDTLKASLAHAHRMVSNLRSNLHREKMEKFELRKLLSESQETIEQLQNDPASWIDQPSSSSQRTQRKARRRKASSSGHKVSRPTAIAAAGGGGGLMSGKSDVDDEGDKESEWSEEDEDEDEGPLSPEPLSLDPAFQVLHPQQTLADQLSAAIEHHPMEPTTADIAIQTCVGEYEDLGVQTDKPRWQSRSMPGTGVYPRIGNSIYTQTMPSSYTDHVVTCMKCGSTTLSSSHSNATFVSDNKISSPSSSNNSNVQAERSSGIVEPSNVAAAAAEPKTLTQSEADAMIAAALAPYKSLQREQPPNPKAQAPIPTTTTNTTNTTTTFTTHHPSPPQQQQSTMEDTDEEESDDEATTASSVRVANNTPSILLSKATTASSRATSHHHLSRSDSNNHGVVYVKPQTTVATCYLNNNNHQRRASESGSISTFSESKLSLAPYNNNLSLQQPDTMMDTATTTASSSSSVMNGDGSSAIALITQTMIGDWMWKYTRKAVGNGISERRHKRFFWIHPYTRTLYWSAHAPGMDGREVRAKSASIEGIATLPDHSPGPKVSLLIQTAGRQLRITAEDAERHQVWFESLSYLLARSSPSEEIRPVPSHSTNSSSLLKKASFPRLRPSKSVSSFAGSSSLHRSAGGGAASTLGGLDDDDDDEELEDVRMCCNGKHHVSKLHRGK
ncbi:nuclear migration protein [Lichtheimia corymbifera JMRC:FSU:9682]|uniref:Nuclear migration protein n=1 Tax=Lichtheimia corymbifera JMRC:FSU:9682 TaxID=1263082 RepID=A0A068S7E9_9FUNG|nr:nuclear migration protein [Lichtheimia corymbifera JMRC:FSU:9682]